MQELDLKSSKILQTGGGGGGGGVDGGGGGAVGRGGGYSSQLSLPPPHIQNLAPNIRNLLTPMFF